MRCNNNSKSNNIKKKMMKIVKFFYVDKQIRYVRLNSIKKSFDFNLIFN